MSYYFSIIDMSWVIIINILLCWCFEIKYDRVPDVVNLWNVAQVARVGLDSPCSLLIGLDWTTIFVLRIEYDPIYAVAFGSDRIEQKCLFFGSDWIPVKAFRKPSDSKALIWSDALLLRVTYSVLNLARRYIFQNEVYIAFYRLDQN